MPQVSKRWLSKDIEEKMFALFFQAFARLSKPMDIAKFLNDLLGPVERIMLAKRLAIAVLLRRGYDYESIKQTLRVSSETIARVNISLNYSGEGYTMVVDEILKDKQMREFWEKVEDALTTFIPPVTGLTKALHKHKWGRKAKGSLD